jgi:hypothetical protein
MHPDTEAKLMSAENIKGFGENKVLRAQADILKAHPLRYKGAGKLKIIERAQKKRTLSNLNNDPNKGSRQKNRHPAYLARIVSKLESYLS